MKYADFIERKRHGSHDFPMQYYDLDGQDPQYVMAPHWHREFEIIRVLEGNFRVFLNNRCFLLKEGDILLVESGCLHRGEPEDCHYECLVFDVGMLRRQQSDVIHRYITPLMQGTAKVEPCLRSRHARELTDRLFTAVKEGRTYYEMEVYGCLFSLFGTLYEDGNIVPSIKSNHSHQAKVMLELLDWIEKNYTEPITLEQMSKQSGFSCKYLCRLFKQYTSQTPMNYINELRIENACHQMAVENKNVTRAAYDSGFNDLSYFCKAFKKHMGLTPGEYKKATAVKATI